MKSKLIVLFFALGLSWLHGYAQMPEDTSATAAPLTMELSLDDCLRIALSDNPTVKVADMEVTRTDYSRIETLSQLLPQASFAGAYSRAIAKQVMYMNMDLDDMFGGLGGGTLPGEGENPEGETPASRADSKKGGNDGGIKVGLDNSYQMGFSVSLPLVAPQLWASLKLSDSQILQAVENARASKLNMVNSVKSAYYGLMLAYDSKKVLQESYDMAAFTHDLYQKQFELGAASDYDVLRTSVAMKNIEPQLMQADVTIKQARLQLMLLMGLDASQDFTIKGTLSDYEKTMHADVLAIDKNYDNNSQLILNNIQTQMLDQTLKVQKAAIYPTLAASFNYNWTSMSNGSPFKNFRWNPYSMIALSLNIPIFTGGQRWSRIKAAEVQLDEMKWTRQNLERSVAMQVDVAVDNIKVNVEQIASCSENVAQAERAHNIMEESFAIGAASYLNLRDSELALTQSRLVYYQAIYNYLVAQSSLELLLGNAPIDKYQALGTRY